MNAFICHFEDKLTQLRRQVKEPSSFSLPVPFTVNPPSSAAFQDSSALGNIQISRSRVTITLERTSSNTSRSQLTESLRALPSTQTATLPSSDLETRVKQLEEEITKARDSRETIASNYRSQFAFLYNKIRALESGGRSTILWKLTSLKIVLDTAKCSARLDNAAKDPSNQYNRPVYHTHPYGYNFFVQFYTYGLDSAERNHASIVFAFFPGRPRWFIETAVHQNDSLLSPRSTRLPEYVDYHLRTPPEDILSRAYQRTITYADELQLLPTQQDVQQN